MPTEFYVIVVLVAVVLAAFFALRSRRSLPSGEAPEALPPGDAPKPAKTPTRDAPKPAVPAKAAEPAKPAKAPEPTKAARQGKQGKQGKQGNKQGKGDRNSKVPETPKAKAAEPAKPAEAPKASVPPKAAEAPKASVPPKAAEPAKASVPPKAAEPVKVAEAARSAEPVKAAETAPSAEPARASEAVLESRSVPVAEPAEAAPVVVATPVVVAPSKPVVAPVAAPKYTRPARDARDLTALKKGLGQTRSGWMSRLLAVFAGKKELDPNLLEQIEETLLTGDVGASLTRRMVDDLKERLDRKEISDADTVWAALREDARKTLTIEHTAFGPVEGTKGPWVVLMVGVNGAGKTTTIAKLASHFKHAGKRVMLAAGDTFRAAAVQQLEMWGRRVGVDVHKGKDGAKPSAVVFEAVQRAVQEDIEVVIADTAGRLQNKAPLMEELRKIRDACGKASPGSPHEVLLVLDATTGQNAISQAREFRETLDVTGVVLTKLDGTAKGGVILAVVDEFKLPVRFIGVGEKSDDLREFDADDFVEALFARDDEASASA